MAEFLLGIADTVVTLLVFVVVAKIVARLFGGRFGFYEDGDR